MLTAVELVPKIRIILVWLAPTCLAMNTFIGIIGNYVGNHLPIRTIVLAFLLRTGILLMAEAQHYALSTCTICFTVAFPFMGSSSTCGTQ